MITPDDHRKIIGRHDLRHLIGQMTTQAGNSTDRR
jgi:hypothetical protein